MFSGKAILLTLALVPAMAHATAEIKKSPVRDAQMTLQSAYDYQQAVGAMANYSTAADTWGDLDSITLAPGDWDISAIGTFYSSGTTSTTFIHIGISTTSGSVNADMNPGDNMSLGTKGSTFFDSLAIPSFRVTPLTTTTYYLKSYAATSTTNLQIAYRISAHRVK